MPNRPDSSGQASNAWSVALIGEMVDLADLYRLVREAELRQTRHEDDVKIYQRDPNKVKALAERMLHGRSARKKMLDKVAPMWTGDRRRA